MQSRLGEGTTIAVYLQRTPCEVSRRTGGIASGIGGCERILLVDDDPRMVDVCTQLLEQLGYRVTSTVNSAAALAMFRADPERFDIVITDQSMPEVTGLELAKRMAAIRADVPVIVATGYSETVTAENARNLGLRGYIQKPYRLAELDVAVRTALTTSGSQRA